MNKSNEGGMILVLADRLIKQRLPRATSLQKKVNDGEILSDFDVSFLEEVFTDINKIKAVIDKHPEWQPLAAKMMTIYTDIMNKAIINEENHSCK